MPWASEVSKTLTIDDWGPAGTAYETCYAKATLVATTSGDKVKYTITMKTSVGGGTSKKPGVALYLSIDDQVILNKYWVYNTVSDGWRNFPTLNGSTYSGEITTKAKNDASIPITLKIATSQNAVSNSSVWKSTSGTLTRTWYTPITRGSVTVTDNGNNTFTLTTTAGTAGTNNPIEKTDLTWGFDNYTDYTFTNNKKINITNYFTSAADKALDKIPVYAKRVDHATYGNNGEYSTLKQILQYSAPSVPGKPTISYSKSRFTVKENWTAKWSASTATNNNSPVIGYRIRVMVNGTITAFKGSNGSVLTNELGYYDRESTSTSIVLYPSLDGIKPGDVIKVIVQSYTKDATGGKHLSSFVSSNEYTVQHAGIMRTKVSGAWKEGQVYVKVGGVWKEADVVYTKVNGVWKEAD